jgi:hypothetical protein
MRIKAVVVAVLFFACFTVYGQQPAPSLDDQIRQKEGELKQLRDLKRQERIKELKAELQQLEGNDDAGTKTGAATPQVDNSPAQPQNPTIGTVPLVNLKLAAAPAELMKDLLPPLTACQLVLSADRAGTFSPYEEALCGLARDIDRRKNGYVINTTPPRRVPGIPGAGISLGEDQGLLLPIMLGKLAKAEGKNSFVSFIMQAEDARTDKQVGSAPSNSGSTSLVVKGGVPSVLGWAVENGSATTNVSGTNITFRFNPVGTVQALSGTGYITGFRRAQDDALLNFFRKTSIGLTFDTSRGNDPGTFTGKKQQLAAVSFRYQFVNEREPRLKRYQKDWEQFVATEGVAFAKTVYSTTLAIQQLTGPKGMREYKFKDLALQSWLEQTDQLLSGPGLSTEAIKGILIKQFDLLPIKQLSTETADALTDFGTALVKYSEAKNNLLDKIAKGRVVTFEYTNNRQVNSPDTSSFNFIAEGGSAKRIDLTLNAALNIFNKKPVGLNVGRVRDFQFAGQLDVPLGDVFGLGQSVLSFAGRYQRLMENAITQAGTVIPNTKGDIAYGQAKLTVPIKGTGIRIPFSISFSNRTELIKEKDVRGNFGFTFDLDSIFARFKPF